MTVYREGRIEKQEGSVETRVQHEQRQQSHVRDRRLATGQNRSRRSDPGHIVILSVVERSDICITTSSSRRQCPQGSLSYAFLYLSIPNRCVVLFLDLELNRFKARCHVGHEEPARCIVDVTASSPSPSCLPSPCTSSLCLSCILSVPSVTIISSQIPLNNAPCVLTSVVRSFPWLTCRPFG